MSRKKRGGAADDIYRNHLRGTPYMDNAVTDRVALIERMYMRILTELAVNRFKWSGLPDEVDVRWLELTLFYRAISVFFWDKDYDKYFALQGAGQNYLNMMNNPTGFIVTGSNYTSKSLPAYVEGANQEKGKFAVPIWANYLRVPDLDIVQVFSSRFANMERTIEINSENARQSRVIVSGQDQRLSYQNINRQIDEGQNNIEVAGPAGDLEFIKVLDLGVDPDTIEKMDIVFTRQWNRCMGLLGIDNANQDKKERLVASEVDANNDQTAMHRFVNLNARRMAADQINKAFGLNVSVDYYTEVEVMAQEAYGQLEAVA